MARLPIPGSDDNSWGNILNDYLSQAHQSDGALKAGSVASNNLGGDITTAGKSLLTAADATAQKSAMGAQSFLNSKGSVLDQTSYSPGDVFHYKGFDVVARTALSGVTTTNPFISAANYSIIGGDGAVIFAHRFGVRASGQDSDAATNQANLVRAVNYCGAQGGGIVQLPAGNIRFTGNLNLPQGVILRGTGMLGTYLQAAFNSNYDYLVSNTVAPSTSGQNAMFTGVRDLCLDGRRDNQTAGTGHGVRFSTNPIGSAASGDSFFDPHHIIHNVRVYKARGNGFHIEGRSALQATNFFAQTCGGWGFWSTFDTNIGYGESEQCDLGGFYFNNGSIRASVLKAFLCGSFVAGSTSPGFFFGANCYAFAGSSFEAQNNTGPGFHLNGCTAVSLVAASAESNWKDPMTSGVGPTAGAGFVLNGATNCVIIGTSTQGRQNSVTIGNQQHAISLTGSSSANYMALSHKAILGATVGAPVQSGSVLTGNHLIANGITLAPTASAGATSAVVKTVNETRNNTATAANDSELSVPVDANSAYTFTIKLRLQAASATPDWRFSWGLPAGASGDMREGVVVGTGASPTVATNATFNLTNGSVAGVHYVTFQAWMFTGSTAGNIVLRWAQSTATAEDSTVMAGSLIEYTKLY